MIIIRRVGAHRPANLSLILHMPFPQPESSTSFPSPLYTLPWIGCDHSGPPRGQTFLTLGIAEGGDYPPPGPLPFPTRGGERSGPTGRTY